MRTVGAARITGFGTSIFTEMSRLAVEHQAVNLGQGFPDFPGPDFVKDAAKAAIDADRNQYAPSHGVPELRQAVARDWTRRFGREIDPDREVTVTSGATEAIFDTIMALLDPGDELIAFEPFYDSYPTSVQMVGGVFRPMRLHAPDWTFDPDELAALFTPRTRVLLLNTPHNPTGKVFSRAELETIAGLCRAHDVIVVSDEVYDRITFDGARHIPIATLPDMWERTLTLNSTGKTFSMTGWKIGYAIGPAALQSALRGVHQFVTFASGTPFQIAMADAFDQAWESGYFDDLQRIYQHRRDLLREVLVVAGLPPFPVSGSYFLTSDVTQIGHGSAADFCRWLTTEIGVAAIPTSAFYLDPETAPAHARFCFAKSDETLRRAGERLAAVTGSARR